MVHGVRPFVILTLFTDISVIVTRVIIASILVVEYLLPTHTAAIILFAHPPMLEIYFTVICADDGMNGNCGDGR